MDSLKEMRYKDKVHTCLFNIPNYYKLERFMGKGAYGFVCEATNTKSGKKVAIKKFMDGKDFSSTINEISILKYLNHPNIISLVDIIPSKNTCIIMEAMSINLEQAIPANPTLSLLVMKAIVYQLLCALLYMKKVGIIHRDIKPANILINADVSIKLCDFGIARGILASRNIKHKEIKKKGDEDDQGLLTNYVVTRFYRAPELLLENGLYDYQCDIWSVGCIFAELILRTPFLQGKDTRDQIFLIFEHLGIPSSKDLQDIKCISDREKLAEWCKQYKNARLRALSPMPRTGSALGDNLLYRMLTINPYTRITVEEAVDHPFFEDIKDWYQNNLKQATECKQQPFLQYENYIVRELSDSSRMDLIWQQVLELHPEYLDQYNRWKQSHV